MKTPTGDQARSFRFFPSAINRSSAPEAAGPDMARLLENIDAQTPGRLTRRLGQAPVNIDPVAGNVFHSQALERLDGTTIMLSSTFNGEILLDIGAAIAPTLPAELGGAGSQLFNETFNEEGNS